MPDVAVGSFLFYTRHATHITYSIIQNYTIEMRGKVQRDPPVLELLEPPGTYGGMISQFLPSPLCDIYP